MPAWLYAGFFAGVIANAVGEPAYAILFVIPLMLALGLPPPVVTLAFTIATAVAGALNLIYQKVYGQGPILHVEHLRGFPALLGVAAGVVVWIFLNWTVLKWLVSTALFATGVKVLGVIRGASPRTRAVRQVVNFAVGLFDAMLGTSTAFALTRAFFGEIEALAPVLRTAEAAASIALKHAIFVGGAVAGVGVFLGQRLIHCGHSKRLHYVVGVVIISTALYTSLPPNVPRRLIRRQSSQPLD